MSGVEKQAGCTVDDIMRYENGEMDEAETIAFFQGMIDTGFVWQLQGSYGRTAAALIDTGFCHMAHQKREA